MSPSSRSRLSYKDQLRHQKRRMRFTLMLVLALLVFLLFSSLVLQPWVLDTVSLEPAYRPGTSFLLFTYAFGGTPHRGDLVAVRAPYSEPDGLPMSILNALLRFVTFQKAGNGEKLLFKRVVAVPGDTVMMRNSEARIKAPEGRFFLSEFEVSRASYDIAVPELPKGWQGPLSGDMDELTLSDDEFFVLGDNRGASNDSRYWGPVSSGDIRGRVVLIYWPLKSFGFPR